MSTVLEAALPVFALILLGWFVGRRRLFKPGAIDTLNHFVVYLALPSLIFHAMATITRRQLDNVGFLVAFSIGMLACFGASYLLDRRRRMADATIDALSAGYSNAGYMGIPIAVFMLGPAALLPAVLASILTVCALFALAIVLVELDLQEAPSLTLSLRRLAVSLARNPLVVSPVLGGLYAASNLPFPVPLASLTQLLGDAASPVALVTIGLFLSEAGATPVRPRLLAGLVTLKLVVQPLITAVLVYKVFRMDPVWARTAVLLAALPNGTGPFMLAKLYNRDAGLTSRAILVSTVISVVTVSIVIALIGK